jgi:long-chain acyl-CoA synthetase
MGAPVWVALSPRGCYAWGSEVPLMPTFKPKFETLVDIFQASVREHSDRPLFGVRERGAYRFSTYGDFGRAVDRVRSGLAQLGVGQGDRVAIVSNNRPGWAIAAYATYGLGAAFVSMYELQRADEQRYILADSGAKVVFVANDAVRAALLEDRAGLEALEHVIQFDGPVSEPAIAYGALLDRGASKPHDLVVPDPESTAAFIYTSGTTGNPKGVMLSHLNIASNVSALHRIFPMRTEDRSLSLLPWSHVFGQTAELHALFSLGASIGLAESFETVARDLAEMKPTLIIGVPRVFSRFRESVIRGVEREGGIKKRLFESAIKNVEKKKALAHARQSSGMVDLLEQVFERAIFEKVRDRFGGRLKFAFSGGAALPLEVAEFIDALGILVYEGYGLTETSPIATANYPGSRKMGSVGKPIPGVQVEIDTSVMDDPKYGEIVIYGHGVMQGYHNLPEENASVFVTKNGRRGIRTGDIGYFDGQGFLHLTGRIKEQFKLENGKYVVPTPLEDKLRLSPFISSCMIHGANKPYNVAVVVPDFEALEAWAAERGLTRDHEELIAHPEVRALYDREVDAHSVGFKRYERIKRVVLGTVDFTPENRMLTPTLKIRRDAVLEVYGDALEGAYEDDPG